ncbi:DNA primase family protein [Oceanibaculum indicum]|uniref:Primase n=1 Tax=Oceanibaculum indicum P24 TaxID=1207063 RepID=K2IL72_9PROT|nr:phage/plasmid primase, P4 family [Oceanibaculum indicum]EKE70881.1 primase [Oceanibaculum indicum P24]
MAAKSEPPNKLAEEIMEERRLIADDGGRLYEYDAGFWRQLSDAELHAWALAVDGPRSTSARRRGEIVSFLRAACHQPVTWGRVADYEIACRNGVVDCRSGEIRPHRPEDYLERVMAWDYSPRAQCPRWLACLEDWFGDPDAPPPEDRGEGQQPPEIEALQEFFGYIVLGHARYKKALVLFGESNSGKTVPLHVAKHMVGQDACCTLAVEHMDNPVLRWVIKGKLLNVVTELSVDAVVADGGFKTLISTEEPVLLNGKNEKPELYTPRAKHVFATNSLPRLNDRTEGVLNRLLIVPFTRVIPPDRQDDGLEAALLEEMQGILCWAIEGAKRLVERRGRFTEVPKAREVLSEMRIDANPVRQFLRERLMPDNKSAIPLATLVDVYNRWNKGSRKISTRFLGKLLRECGQVVKNVRYSDDGVMSSLIGFRVNPYRPPSSFQVRPEAIMAVGPEVTGAADAEAPPEVDEGEV